MVLFEWEKKYETGILEVDLQHRKLVSIINDLHEAMSKGEVKKELSSILLDLESYTRYHFTTEENIMSEKDYPDLNEHRRQHLYFISRIEEMTKRLEDGEFMITVDLNDLLKDWLSGHILGMDRKFAPFIRQN